MNRPWMQAHPRRNDNLRIVLQGIFGFLVLLSACIVVPGVGA